MAKIKKILKLSASWCTPCRAFAKTFNTVRQMDNYKDIEFVELDIEDENNQAEVEKYKVRSVPTTVILDENDSEIYKVMGNIPLNDFTTIIDEAKKRQA